MRIVENFEQSYTNLHEKFTAVLQSIGGKVFAVKNVEEATVLLQAQFGNEGRFISLLKSFESFATFYNIHAHPHLLENVEVAIISAQFGVAENGSVWVTDKLLPTRVLPFICQHLVVILERTSIISTMHNAYDIIDNAVYGFGAFIAGPSKTADIEQSLVLGAHGPKTMTIFLMG